MKPNRPVATASLSARGDLPAVTNSPRRHLQNNTYFYVETDCVNLRVLDAFHTYSSSSPALIK